MSNYQIDHTIDDRGDSYTVHNTLTGRDVIRFRFYETAASFIAWLHHSPAGCDCSWGHWPAEHPEYERIPRDSFPHEAVSTREAVSDAEYMQAWRDQTAPN